MFSIFLLYSRTIISFVHFMMHDTENQSPDDDNEDVGDN